MAGWFDILRRSLGWPSKPTPQPKFVDDIQVYEVSREHEFTAERLTQFVQDLESEYALAREFKTPESAT